MFVGVGFIAYSRVHVEHVWGLRFIPRGGQKFPCQISNGLSQVPKNQGLAPQAMPWAFTLKCLVLIAHVFSAEMSAWVLMGRTIVQNNQGLLEGRQVLSAEQKRREMDSMIWQSVCVCVCVNWQVF